MQYFIPLLGRIRERGARRIGVRQTLRYLLPPQLQICHEGAQQEPVEDPRNDEKIHDLGGNKDPIEVKPPEGFHELYSPAYRPMNAKIRE